ncbi:MAG: glycosyltransferase family 2 protein [Pelolinea sp.]|nr:glycosyltransferase family 2 protein [Pelolinea sp.]
MKIKLPLVSIITPSYNQGQFLEQTIRSVLLQDYSEIEYIIIDGGSTDNTQDVVDKYRKKLAWYITERDQGQADAINKGFAKATGEYVAWINSDDIYTEHAISNAVKQLIMNPDCGMVFSNVLSIDSDTKIFNTMVYGDWGLSELMQFNIIGQPGVFMRRKVLQEANYLDPNFHYLLDHHLWLKIASRYPIKYVNDFWAAARFHIQAKNIAQPTGFSKEAFHIYDWIEDEPDLQMLFNKNKRKIKAGAYLVKARYLLDSNNNWAAFKNYLKSINLNPSILFQEKNRIAYSLINSFLPVENLKEKYLENKSRRILRQDLNYLIDYLKK